MKQFITVMNVCLFFYSEKLLFLPTIKLSIWFWKKTQRDQWCSREEILNLYLHTVMLHANVGLTYLQTGGSPKPINESTSLTPLCNCTVLVCPSFYTCEPAVSEWQIYKPCVTFIFAPPTCTPHSQNTETFPSSFNFWDKGYRTPVIFFNVQSLKTRVHFKKKLCDFLCHFPWQTSALFTVQ